MDNYEKIFADKLKSLRKQRGLRQNDVANAVGYSEKSVSKWESGKVLPPVNALLALCDVFGVELADLLDIKHETSYFLGIDGGATKTDFVLANANGDIIRKKRLGSTNAFDIGLNAAKALLTEGINDICRGISIRKISMYAGLSGGTSGNMRQIFGEFFNSFGFNKALSQYYSVRRTGKSRRSCAYHGHRVISFYSKRRQSLPRGRFGVFVRRRRQRIRYRSQRNKIRLYAGRSDGRSNDYK